MNIETNDVISLQVALNEEGKGDNASIELDNKGGKYDELINPNTRFSKTWTIYGGYNGSTVPIFTGKNFFLRKSYAHPNTISGDFLERDSYAEKAPLISEYVSDMNIIDIIEYIYTKYLGYTAGEISSSGDWSGTNHEIEFLEFRNESPTRKLTEIVEALGGSIYNNADGELLIDKNFTNHTVDFTYNTDQLISWSREVTATEDLANEIEIVGREKDLEQMLGDNEKVLNLASLRPGKFGGIYIDTNYRRFRDEFLKQHKGGFYTPSATDGEISLLKWSVPGIKVTPGEARNYCVMNIENKDLKAIPTDVEIKELDDSPLVGNMELWYSKTSDYTVEILGWTEDKIYVRIGGVSPSGSIADNKKVIVYGNAIDSKYIMNKGQVYTDRRIYDVYKEFGQDFATHFYTRLNLIDPSTGVRMSDWSGVTKKITKNLNWVKSDAQANFVANRIFEKELISQNKFEITVPFNPLLERGDLVEVTTKDDTIKFWVNSIKHNLDTFSRSTFSGFIYDSDNISWGSFLGTGGWTGYPTP